MAEKKKPERRKSALSNMSPVAPPPPEEKAPAPVSTPVSAEATTEAKAEGRRWPKKESFYRSPELAMRMRSTLMNTMMTEDGKTSLSAFIASAVEEKIERLEAKYNDGKPWPEVGPIPRGAPRNWTT